MSDEVLRLRGVAVSYEKSMLLRDVDWTVRSNESWVVIGPNGAGKTTLLQVAGAMLAPTSGSVEILGEALEDADLTDLRTRIDPVFLPRPLLLVEELPRNATGKLPQQALQGFAESQMRSADPP